jgi:hypothetical protein
MGCSYTHPGPFLEVACVGLLLPEVTEIFGDSGIVGWTCIAHYDRTYNVDSRYTSEYIRDYDIAQGDEREQGLNISGSGTVKRNGCHTSQNCVGRKFKDVKYEI